MSNTINNTVSQVKKNRGDSPSPTGLKGIDTLLPVHQQKRATSTPGPSQLTPNDGGKPNGSILNRKDAGRPDHGNNQGMPIISIPALSRLTTGNPGFGPFGPLPIG